MKYPPEPESFHGTDSKLFAFRPDTRRATDSPD